MNKTKTITSNQLKQLVKGLKKMKRGDTARIIEKLTIKNKHNFGITFVEPFLDIEII